MILRIRAGTGGDEAALFVGDCVECTNAMRKKKDGSTSYFHALLLKWADLKNMSWCFQGHNVFRMMQYEAGTHRVQRVPATEAKGRVHTSAITVAVLLEPDEERKSYP